MQKVPNESYNVKYNLNNIRLLSVVSLTEMSFLILKFDHLCLPIHACLLHKTFVARQESPCSVIFTYSREQSLT